MFLTSNAWWKKSSLFMALNSYKSTRDISSTDLFLESLMVMAFSRSIVIEWIIYQTHDFSLSYVTKTDTSG